MIVEIVTVASIVAFLAGAWVAGLVNKRNRKDITFERDYAQVLAEQWRKVAGK